jgi:hypothetical protein
LPVMARASGAARAMAARTAGTRLEPPVKKIVSISPGRSPAAATQSAAARPMRSTPRRMARSNPARVACAPSPASMNASGSSKLSASLRAILPLRRKVRCDGRGDRRTRAAGRSLSGPAPRAELDHLALVAIGVGEIDRGPGRELPVERVGHGHALFEEGAAAAQQRHDGIQADLGIEIRAAHTHTGEGDDIVLAIGAGRAAGPDADDYREGTPPPISATSTSLAQRSAHNARRRRAAHRRR